MKKIFLFNIIFSFVIFAQQKELTLEESLEIGFKNSKELKISQSKLVSADAKITEIGSQLLPKFTLGASYTRLSEVGPFRVAVPFAPQPIQIQESFFNNYSLNLTVKQPLFTGFKLLSLRKAAKYNFEAQEFEQSKEANEVAWNIKFAFWNFYKVQKVAFLIDENLKALKKHLDDTKQFLENGLVAKNDLLKIEVKYSNLKLKKIDADNNVNLARVNFNKSIGIALSKQTNLISLKNKIDVDKFKYDELVAEAFQKREELKSINSRIKAGEENVSAAISGWFPSIFLFGHVYYSNPNQRVLPLEDKFNSTWDVGVSMNWNLWDWGNTKAKSVQAEQQVFQSTEMLKLLKEGIEVEVYRNYLKLLSESDKVEASKKILESADENFRITQNKYSQQLATSSDLIDAEVELLNAQTQLATSKIDLELAKVNLEKSVGRRIF